MSATAKIFTNGRSQAVRLPMAFRFDTAEVFIRQDPDSGDVILSKKPVDWDGFLQLLPALAVDDDFLSPQERQQETGERDPFSV
ncbi:MAG: AbrB/MazE/SpoVT family DNA-binding domain-containing protein [Betaproteobacteria bacterium]|jgi:antitoxin VapB|nr:AbrB/MazE/SpoVT family DNA-binding domain-containing protein [Betaproteobacteria bacterium]